MIFHVSRNLTYKPQGSKFKNAQNTTLFFKRVMKYQNTKNETPKSHHESKPPKIKKFKTLFTLN